ncbi:MAG: hypothetical protein ACKO3G_16750 [Planctomycetaceae bacterium]
MVQIPDSVRPTWDFVAKYHFWLLTPLVPILLLPALFLTNGKLSAEMAARRSEIDGKLSALNSVGGITPHPNDTWTTDIDKRTDRVKRETLAEWQRLWDSQADLHLWPAEIGDDFLQRLSNLKAGRELPRAMVERYTLFVRDQAKKLPGRMSADMLMLDPEAAAAEGAGQRPDGGGPPGMGTMMAQMMRQGGPRGMAGEGAPRSGAMVDWDAADQQRVYDSFHWDTLPRTKQIVLAQEEMKLYELLCDQVAAANKGARGSYEAAIPRIEQLAVGYLAAEDEVAVSTQGRIHQPNAQAGGDGSGMGSGMMGGSMPPSGGGGGGMPTMMAGGAMPSMPGMGGGEAAAVSMKPLHPRFMPRGGQGGGRGGMGMMPGMPPMGGPMGGPMGEGGAPQAPQDPGNSDEALMTWIYCDADGKPLTGAEVATSPSAVLMHFVPFVIRAKIDQRRLDAFLVQLATLPAAPIEIRQVRVNPDSKQAAGPAGGRTGMPSMMSGPPGMGGPPMGGPGGAMGGGPSLGGRRMPQGMGGPPGMTMGPPGMAGAETAVLDPLRPHDVIVEVRGTIALATPPDPTRLGLEADVVADPNAGGDAAAPAADDPAPAPVAEPAADGGAAAPAVAPAADGQPAAVPPDGGPADAPPADAPPADATPAPPADPPPADAVPAPPA